MPVIALQKGTTPFRAPVFVIHVALGTCEPAPYDVPARLIARHAAWFEVWGVARWMEGQLCPSEVGMKSSPA